MGDGVPAILCWKSQHLGCDRCHLPILTHIFFLFLPNLRSEQRGRWTKCWRKTVTLTPSSYGSSRRGYWNLRDKSFWSEQLQALELPFTQMREGCRKIRLFIHEYERDVPPSPSPPGTALGSTGKGRSYARKRANPKMLCICGQKSIEPMLCFFQSSTSGGVWCPSVCPLLVTLICLHSIPQCGCTTVNSGSSAWTNNAVTHNLLHVYFHTAGGIFQGGFLQAALLG